MSFFRDFLDSVNLKGTKPIGPPGNKRGGFMGFGKLLNPEEKEFYRMYIEKYKQENMEQKLDFTHLRDIIGFSNEPLNFFDKHFPQPSDEEMKESLKEANEQMKKLDFYPVENEEGLYYRMRVLPNNDYRWEVFNDEFYGCKMSSDAKTNSLRQVVDRFKREFCL